MSTLRRGRVEGRFSVAADGRLLAAQIVTSTSPKLDAAALAAMRQWSFAPMTAARSAIVEFGFDLDRDAPASASRGQELVAIDQPEPRWDASVMQALRKGRIQLRFEVGTDGNIVRSEVVSSSAPQLAAAALEAMQQWHFQPIAKARTASIEFGFDLDR